MTAFYLNYIIYIFYISHYYPCASILFGPSLYLITARLFRYLERHPEMDSRCTKGATCRYYTTESVETFLPNASIFLNSAIDADSVTL